MIDLFEKYGRPEYGVLRFTPLDLIMGVFEIEYVDGDAGLLPGGKMVYAKIALKSLNLNYANGTSLYFTSFKDEFDDEYATTMREDLAEFMTTRVGHDAHLDSRNLTLEPYEGAIVKELEQQTVKCRERFEANFPFDEIDEYTDALKVIQKEEACSLINLDFNERWCKENNEYRDFYKVEWAEMQIAKPKDPRWNKNRADEVPRFLTRVKQDVDAEQRIIQKHLQIRSELESYVSRRGAQGVNELCKMLEELKKKHP